MDNISVKIDCVSRLSDISPEISNFSIDIPQNTNKSSDLYIDVAGWVIGKKQSALSIEVINNDFVLSRTPITLQRDDVAEHYPDIPWASTSGFRTQINTLGLPKSFTVTIQVVLSGENKQDRIRTSIATISGSHSGMKLGSRHIPKRQPLLITALGRSGTTWLMHLLSGDESIAAVTTYPYETRAGVYWMHALYVLSSPGNHTQSTRPDAFETNLFNIGSCPYFHPTYTHGLENCQQLDSWFANDYSRNLAYFCQTSIDNYYDVIRKSFTNDTSKFFMEKNLGGHIPWVCTNSYDHAKEIVLIRDFRDMFCSSKSFNEKRGFDAFGKQLVDNDQDWIKNRYRGAKKMIANWEKRKDQSLLVRYEDLILTPEKTLIRIFEYLDIDASTEHAKQLLDTARHDTPELLTHRTSNNPINSIGRWKQDMDEDTKQLFNSMFGDILREFGYS